MPMTKRISRYWLPHGDKMLEADDGEWVRYVDVARFLPGYDRGREHPNTWPADEPPANPSALKCPTCKRPFEEVKLSELREYFEPPANPQSPFNWDACDEHETAFPKGAECPKCLVSLLREVLAEDDANVDTATTLSCDLIDRIRAVVNGQAEPPTKPSEQKLLDHLFEVHHCNCDLTKL
jgi:hypothetical protein